MHGKEQPNNPAKKVLSMPKSAQEISMDGDEPPQLYIIREKTFGALDTSPPLGPVPVIDMGLLSSSTSSLHLSKGEENELEKLRSTLSTWGCFQAIGHGMSIEFLNKVREVMKQFFALPMEEKKHYSRAGCDAEGYGSSLVVSEKQVLDWCDRLALTTHPEDLRNFKLWPENPKDFRETLDEYSGNIKSIISHLLKAMAKSLNLEENSFSKQFGERPIMKARFGLYPPCSRPDQVFGLKAHSDRSGVTFLLQDKEVEGLQVLKDDEWFRVPLIPHAIIVNLGDQMQIMSNGMFRSPMHRVVTNSEKERISLAVFCFPGSDREIEPVEELIDEKRPRLYRKVKNYVDIYFQSYQQGKRPLDAAKI